MIWKMSLWGCDEKGRRWSSLKRRSNAEGVVVIGDHNPEIWDVLGFKRLGYGMHYSRRSVVVAALRYGTAEELFGRVCCHIFGLVFFVPVSRGFLKMIDTFSAAPP